MNGSANSLHAFSCDLQAYASEGLLDQVFRQCNGDDRPERVIKRLCPTVLKHLYTVKHPDFSDLVKQGCAFHCNRATLSQSVALTEICFLEQPLTCRGAFYRAVSSGIYPDTGERHYRQCLAIVLKLRRGGIIPYEFIVDGTRRTEKPSSWSGLVDYLESVRQSYRCDLWQRQRDYLEIFVEKDAMAAVLTPVTYRYDVGLNIIRGGCSETFAWTIAQQWQQIEKPIRAYYLGDHDPAGLLIERDLRDRLSLLSDGVAFEWERIAISTQDFRRPDLIGFAIKGDRRSKPWQTKHADYLRDHGDRCVEVDAIPSNEIRERVEHVIEGHIDQTEWRNLQHQEKVERQTFQEIVLAQKALAEVSP